MVSLHDVCALILRSGPLTDTRSLMLGAGAVLEKLQGESPVEFLHDAESTKDRR